jgi:hypothetical protein
MNGRYLVALALSVVWTTIARAADAPGAPPAPVSAAQTSQPAPAQTAVTDPSAKADAAQASAPMQQPAAQPAQPAPTQAPPPPPADPGLPPAEGPAAQSQLAPTPPPPAQAPQAPNVQAPQPPGPQLTAATGQWVYTSQYGWVWMPYAQAYTHVPATGYPYMYLYYPAFGWRWSAAPWVFGWGPRPYWGAWGMTRFAWHARPWFRPRPYRGEIIRYGGGYHPARPVLHRGHHH